MTPKPDDAKPDALEELKEAITTVDTACRMGIASAGLLWGAVAQRMGTAIAAWEKERAERDSVPTLVLLRQRTNELGTLRAAVETVRDELIQTINVRPGAVMACHLREAADALDAALRGGA